MGSTFDPQILPKIIQKHVGIDLEPQIPKIEKMTPLPSFLLVFWFQEVPKSMKNQEKSVPRCIQKSMDFFHRFWSDFWWIFLPSGTQQISKSQPKSHAKIKQKNHFKMIPKISIWASKMGEFFGVFGYQNRPLEAPWAHQGVQTENHVQNLQKVIKFMKKWYKNDPKRSPELWKNVSKMILKVSQNVEKHRATSNRISRNLVI